jgi:hypothetical protein
VLTVPDRVEGHFRILIPWDPVFQPQRLIFTQLAAWQSV